MKKEDKDLIDEFMKILATVPPEERLGEGLCSGCKWILPDDKCLAFPEGIPDKYWEGGGDYEHCSSEYHFEPRN